MIPNNFVNVLMPSDTNGTFFWRGQTAVNQIWAIGPGTGINNTILTKPTTDKLFYQNLRSYMIQRMHTTQQVQFFKSLLEPYSKMFGFWTIYNIDDAMHYRDIPAYNRGRQAFANDEIQQNIKTILDAADFILTTTDYIKEYYHKTYNIDKNKILIIPNLLPRWWIGNFYNLEEKANNFIKHKSKPRIGIISSLSHYNVDNVLEDETGSVVKKETNSATTVYKNERNEIVDISNCRRVKDDLSIILDMIRNTTDEFQWVILGYCPPELEQLAASKKIEIHTGVPIINYPAFINSLKLNAIVAPLLDSEFNRCKSNIKYLEASALGVPLFASDVITYRNYMPIEQLFTDENDLLEKLRKLKNSSKSVFCDIISRQYSWLNKNTTEAGIELKNWWLEDNIHLWGKLFSMPFKSRTYSFAGYLNSLKNSNVDKNQNIIYKNGDLAVSL